MDAYRERVRAGAALLDERRPQWREAIDIGRLDMECRRLCILGQLYGLYVHGVRDLNLVNIWEADSHGFLEMWGDMFSLQRAWIKEITGSGEGV